MVNARNSGRRMKWQNGSHVGWHNKRDYCRTNLLFNSSKMAARKTSNTFKRKRNEIIEMAAMLADMTKTSGKSIVKINKHGGWENTNPEIINCYLNNSILYI